MNSTEEKLNPALPLHWPSRPAAFRKLLTPLEAAQYLRLWAELLTRPTSRRCNQDGVNFTANLYTVF